jgi:wobble nucleotide-excising tRNase
VPFTLKIENQSDIILKKEVPKLKFVFQNQNSKIKEEELTIEELRSKNTLSSGETRVLYLLNILFDIANIENKETLFIIDDIADSFDYRNKYAIIQYLLDLSNNSKFKLIILTHNLISLELYVIGWFPINIV